MSDVFISHSSKDQEIAYNIVEFLESRGISCWIAPRNIVPGSDWAASISTAITASKVFLLIYSENSANSEQCPREIGLAETTKGVTVIPYKADDTELVGAYQYYLTSAHWVTADIKNKDYKYEELYSFISAVLGKMVQNINANTYIEHLHINESEKTANEKTENVNNQKESNGTYPNTDSGIEHKKSKLPLIIGIAGLAVVIIVVLIILMNGDKKPDNSIENRSNVTSGPVTVSGTEIPTPEENNHIEKNETVPTENPAEEVTPTEYVRQKGERKGLTLKINGYVCNMDYYGELNEVGQPDGEGELTGSYISNDKNVQITYKGEFESGAISGKGISTETYEDGHIREYNGIFDKNAWDGEATMTITYISGDISMEKYEGIWNNGSLNGKGKKEIYWFNGNTCEYEGEFLKGLFDGYGDKKILYKANGDSVEYSGMFTEGKYNGTGTYVYIYGSGNTERQVCEGEFIENKFTGKNNVLTNYYKDGTKKTTEGEYKDGKPVSGTTITYAADGNIVKTEIIGNEITVAPPANFHTEDPTSETIRLVWEASDSDVKYLMEVYYDATLENKIVEKEFTGTSIKLTGMKPGDVRYVRIRSEREYEGKVYYSDWVDIEFKTKEAAIISDIKDFDIVFLNKDCVGEYSGEIDDEGKPNGEGKYNGSYTLNGENVSVTYSGNFNGGMIKGYGVSTETFVDGHVREYEGLFDLNNWYGEAVLTLTYASGSPLKIINEGSWNNGNMDPEGKISYYYANGDVIICEGTFKNSVLEGFGKRSYLFVSGDKEVYEGELVNGKKQGKGVREYYSVTDDIEKEIREGDWDNDMFTGTNNTKTNCFRDGHKTIFEGEFIEGKFVSGTITTYDASGAVTKEEAVETKE